MVDGEGPSVATSQIGDARSVPLRRLLTIAVPTPAQAMLISADLLDAAATLPGMTTPVSVDIASDGALSVVADRSGAPLGVLLDDVVQCARHLPAHPGEGDVRLVEHLADQVAAAGDASGRAAALRHRLQHELGTTADERLRRELAMLMEAFGRIASEIAPAAGAGQEPERPAAALHIPAPTWRSPVARWTRRRWSLAAVALAVLTPPVGYLALGAPGTGWFETAGGTPGHLVPKPPPTHPSPVAQQSTRHSSIVVAAASAGAIRSVAVTTPTGCSLGATCQVRVTLQLAPSTTSQVLSWRIGTVQDCARHIRWSPLISMTALPGWTSAYASTFVPLPQARSVRLTALTSAPARAQSPLLAIPPTAPC